MKAAAEIAELAARRKLAALVAGSAIVDVLARVEFGFPESLGLQKGRMQLVDGDRADRIQARMPASEEVSGGGAANTAIGLSQLGLRTAFVGKIARDRLGTTYATDLRRAGVRFETPPLPAGTGPGTGRSLILVTPDSDRTMSTELAASGLLGPADLAAAPVADAALVLMESFLLDLPDNAAACRTGLARARQCGCAVALNLSDRLCVERHRDRIREEIALGVDLLVGDEQEFLALTGGGGLGECVDRIRGVVSLAAITRGARGAIIVAGEENCEVAAAPVDRVVDTTGAGDCFAAGFLFGVLRGVAPGDAAIVGAEAASLVIREMGARPQYGLAGGRQRIARSR